ncbi:MAG: LamG domain-containing protein [Verrucomicrobiales bacterium]|nr:LamG domain-containing protein [Verrucomicrobiales bacterium]MCP5528605.1 LamG domain-containing protein [Verrucomicrobiales bacterium]
MNRIPNPETVRNDCRDCRPTIGSVAEHRRHQHGLAPLGWLLLALGGAGAYPLSSLAADPPSGPALGSPAAQPPTPSSLRHRYSFTYDAKDSIGGAHGELMSGATIVHGAVELVQLGQYVDLPNDLLSDYHAVTIELWATDRGSGPWARLFDFGNSTGGEDFPWPSPALGTRYFFLSLPSAYGNLRGGFTVTGGGQGEQILEWTGGRPPVDEETHIALASDGGAGLGVLYVNGVEVGRNETLTLTPALIGPTANNWLGRSQFFDPTFQGGISEFRIYDTALGPEAVAASFAAGPDKVPYDVSLQTRILMSGGEVSLGLGPAVEGRFYGLEATDDPVNGSWMPLRTVVGNDDWLQVSVGPDASPRFYRARELDVALVNPSFEADRYTRSPGYPKDNRPVTGWTFSGASEDAYRWGVNPGSFGSIFTDNGAIPEGRQALFIEDDGAVSQRVAGLSPGVAYRLHYFENARLGSSPICRVDLGGMEIVAEHEVPPVGETNPYHEVWSEQFTPAGAELDLIFTKRSPDDTGSALLLDAIRMVPVVR